MSAAQTFSSPTGIGFIAMTTVLASSLWLTSAGAQSIEERTPEYTQDHETIAVNFNGQFLSAFGLPYVSLAPVGNEFKVYYTPTHERRRQFRLEGVDNEWREWGGEGFLNLRFFDTEGDQIKQEGFRFLGQSAGWNGSLDKPVFVHRREIVIAPERARSFWVVITSAGPPQVLGTILIKNLVVSRIDAEGEPEVLLRAPLGRDPRSPKVPTPIGFCTDGTRASMARLLSIASASSDSLEDCLAILDNDASAHAEWRTRKDSAPAVSNGDQLLVEWDVAYSVGLGGTQFTKYKCPVPGIYRFRVRPIDILGNPAGTETSLAISILPPWWQRKWLWASLAAGVVACAFGVSRFIGHQKMRKQFSRMKEERMLEQERMRIARDIHDTLAQGLTGIIVQLQAADVAKSRGSDEANNAHVRRASELARESLQEARRSVLALRPLVLEQMDLPEALDTLVHKLTSGSLLQAEVTIGDHPRKLPLEIEKNLLRIALEALTNALRHAQATHFITRLTFAPDEIHLQLIDDGCGFNPDSTHEGFGLTGMKERAEAIGGRLVIQSAVGQGTTICLILTDHESAIRV
jgi:signal transduction histidine kinase